MLLLVRRATGGSGAGGSGAAAAGLAARRSGSVALLRRCPAPARAFAGASARQQARRQAKQARPTAQKGSSWALDEIEPVALIDQRYIWHFKGVMALCIGFAAYHIMPFAYGATVPVSVRLCKSKDPFMQKSGVSRIGFIARNSNMRKEIIVEGLAALVRLMEISEDEEVLKQVLEIVTKLASESADDEREFMGLDSPVEAAQALAVNERWAPELRELAAATVAALQKRDGSRSAEPLI